MQRRSTVHAQAPVWNGTWVPCDNAALRGLRYVHGDCNAQTPSRRTSKDDGPQQQRISPADTDRIVAELRYRNITVPKTLDISWQRRAENLGKVAYKLTRSMFKFLQSVPPALWAASKMTLPEWRSTLSGWWVTIKHEADHYWVCTCNLCHQRRFSPTCQR